MILKNEKDSFDTTKYFKTTPQKISQEISRENNCKENPHVLKIEIILE